MGYAAIASVLAGLLNGNRDLPTVDMGNILSSIQQNRQTNQSLINQLPEAMAPMYAAYGNSLTGAGTQLRADTTGIGQNLLDKTNSLYGPDSDAVKATLAGLKTSDYSTLPGTLNALKASLAATGGLERGGAAKALTAATLAPAQQFSAQSADVMGKQLMTQQSNVQAALNKIAAMDDATANSIFGMSKDQAANILQFGRNDLKDQLSQLINNNNAATAATSAAYGVGDNNAYQNAVTRGAQQTAIVNGLASAGAQGASSLGDMFGTGGTSATSYNPDSMSTPTGENANPNRYGVYF